MPSAISAPAASAVTTNPRTGFATFPSHRVT
jgi:hypothetical protein